MKQSGDEVVEDDLSRIDWRADAFEQVWRRGQRPRIEDHLDGASGTFRSTLVRELLLIEWQRRQRLGECPLPEEYAGRFPELARWIRAAIRGPGPSAETTCVLDSSFPSDDLPRLHDYKLLRVIGRGGMGVVYLARKRSQLHDGYVALKLIAEHLLTRSRIQSFVAEMENLARLQHRHIVQVLDSGQEDGRPYFTMIYYGGSDLAQVLKEYGPLEPITAALYVSCIAWAVRYLHAQAKPLIHRDLKPKNILLDGNGDEGFPFGRPYLADFGLVKLLEKSDPNSSRGAIEGTIPYMSPEQANGENVGPASDVWGLGVILYECLTGSRPFRGDSQAETIYQVLHREPPSPRAIRSEVPLGLQRICLKCLRKPRESRYRSVAELIEDLDCFFQDLPLKHTPPESPRERAVHWAKSEPALAVRVAVIVACSCIIWSLRLLLGDRVPLPPDYWIRKLKIAPVFKSLGGLEWVTHWMNQAILIAWGLASWAFQRRLTRGRHDGGLQLGWRVVDVAALTLIIQIDDALMSPLTVAFAVLIAASAFWARADQIIQTTLLCMFAYVLLILFYLYVHHDLDHPYRHFHYLVGLVVLGVMLAHQANRTRALARICGARDRI